MAENKPDAAQDEALRNRVEKTIKEIRQQQTRPVSFWTDDLVQLIRDLHNWLGTEKSMHQAWRKRAEEAEAQIAALDAARDREVELWLKHASPTPWRIDKDNHQGIEIVAANGDLVAIEDFSSIPTERGAGFVDQIIGVTRANFHLMVILANRLGADAVRQSRRDLDDIENCDKCDLCEDHFPTRIPI